jgi:hypothetical protein
MAVARPQDLVKSHRARLCEGAPGVFLKQILPRTRIVRTTRGLAMKLTSTMIAEAVGGIMMGATGCGGGAPPPAATPAADGAGAAPTGASATPAKHACKAQNDCKGQGGCKTDKHGCKAQNDCKGQGGCKGT